MRTSQFVSPRGTSGCVIGRPKTSYLRSRAGSALLLALTALTALGACGGASSLGESSGTCTWPAAFDSADKNAGKCAAAAAWVTCKGSEGAQICLSDDPTKCPTSDPRFTDCSNDCRSGEYALGCHANFEPPKSCRALPPAPGGGPMYCCACGS